MQKGISLIILIAILLGFPTLSSGGIFDAAEYKIRRTKLMTFIPDGIAIIFGSDCDVMKTYGPWQDFKGKRQNSNFIYFTGVEETNSALVVDGKKRRALFSFFQRNQKKKLWKRQVLRESYLFPNFLNYFHLITLKQILFIPLLVLSEHRSNA